MQNTGAAPTARRSGKPLRLAVLIPAGEVHGRDRVTSYHAGDVARLVATDINIGDTFVFEASLRLLDFDEVVFFPTGLPRVDEAVELLDSCDVAILRGSNYIHDKMNWGALDQVIEKSTTPVVAFGIGAQAPRYEDVPVSAATVRVLQMIAERSHAIGVRGAFTAEIVEKLGIKNVIPIGCPSIFRENNPALRIDWPPPEVARIGYTITRGFSKGYCDDPARATALQLQVLQELDAAHDVYILSQGEQAEKLYYYRQYPRIAEADAALKASGWDLKEMEWLRRLYWQRMFFGVSPRDYADMARFCDITMGFRLHGNIISLSIGRPAIYFTFDSRTRELVEHFRIPAFDIMSKEQFSLAEWLAEPVFDGFNRRLPQAYAIMRDFLDANGVTHRMAPDTTAEEGVEAQVSLFAPAPDVELAAFTPS